MTDNTSTANTAAPLAERHLSDLNDLELAQLTADLKDRESSLRPLVSPLEPIEGLMEEFEQGSVYRRKVERLRADGWTGVRRCRGDGDCFYRAFILSLLLSHLPLHPSHSAHLLAKFESLLPLLSACGFEPIVTDDFWEPLRDVLRNLAGVEESGKRMGEGELVGRFNDQETNSCIIVILRLFTSAYLRTHADEFTPFLFALEDDPRFVQEGGAPSMEEFCSRHVEAVSQEADHLAIASLTRALQVPVRIAYLDQSGLGAGFTDGAGSAGAGAASQGELEVNFLEFEEEALGRGERGVEGALLYRPGHYDILVR
ncbi:hypothetical protein JCM6882_008590 [Rhodosporidiobolus microsporus]